MQLKLKQLTQTQAHILYDLIASSDVSHIFHNIELTNIIISKLDITA